jgi:colanic acid/amylovoran biosynthesis glycosyltransferase
LNTLFLLTNKFPYKGGETFLETEIHYLSKSFDKVIVFPMSGFDNELLPIPINVVVKKFYINQPVYLRRLLLKYGWIIVKWFVMEFIKSPHRAKYISQFKWNFKRLAGLINNAAKFKKDFFSTTQNFDFHPERIQRTIFYSYWFNDWASILAIAKQMGLKGKLISRTHGYDFDEKQQTRGYHPFRYTEFLKFDKVFQVSEYGQNYIQKRFPYAKNLQIAKLGVVDHGFNPILTEQIFQIVSCSNFVPLKRVHLIAEILSNLNVPFHWNHFGDGDGIIEVKKIANRKLPNQNFTFNGIVSNGFLMEWYKRNPVDLFINVSSLEGLPVSLMEAISFGIPIVGCNICGVPEIVNEKTGILLERDFDIIDTSKAIEKFLQDNSRNINFRNGVKQFWRDYFDADSNYHLFTNILKKCNEV